MAAAKADSRPTFVLTAVLFLAIASPAGAAAICGDYNTDKSITAPDALGALRAAVRIVECQRAVCDMNGDDVVTAADALAILRTAVGTGPEAKCPAAGCNGPDCHPGCPRGAVDCCDEGTCSGNGECAVVEGMAECTCDEEWVGATCNALKVSHPFAGEPSRETPHWTAVGDLFVRPPSYGEQIRFHLKPGSFFVAGAPLRNEVAIKKAATKLPVVFPDGQLDRIPLELKAEYTSGVRLIETRAVGDKVALKNRFPKISVYRSLYETDGSIKSVLEVSAVDEGGFMGRGLVRHESNLPDNSGVFRFTVTPLGSGQQLDAIVPVNGTIDVSTLLLSEASFTDSNQAELFEDCDGLSICSDLCTAMGADQGDPGSGTCPPPPDPCEHVSPCGDGHGLGDPVVLHQCNDGVDNDDDDFLDEEDPKCEHSVQCEPGGDIPNHVHEFEAGADFGVFGDVEWCTEYGDQWPGVLMGMAHVGEEPFFKNTGNADYDSLYKWGEQYYDSDQLLVRLKIIGCWRLGTNPEAEACANDVDECGPFASGTHKYPYRFGRDAPGYWKGVKIDVWHARGVGLNEPLNAALTFAGFLSGASEAQFIPGFASVVGHNVNGEDAIPHELGHCFNLTHCDQRQIGTHWSLEGNPLQSTTCPPGGEYHNHDIIQWSNVSGEKLYNCFLNGCGSMTQFGSANPEN